MLTYQANEWYWVVRFGHPLVHTITFGSVFFRGAQYPPRRLAEDEIAALTPADLEILALSASDAARELAAEHTATPPATLSKLTGDLVRRVRRAAGNNSGTPAKAIAQMREVGRSSEVDYLRLDLLWTEVESEPIDMDVAQRIATGSFGDSERLALAKHKDSPIDLLTLLAMNNHLDLETAATLGTSTHVEVRRTLAGNSRAGLGPDLLARLAGDKAPAVRIAAGGNRNLPIESLSRLLEDSDAQVRHEVALIGHIHDDELLRMDLHAHRRPSLHARIASGQVTEHLLRELSGSTNVGTRISVARCPETPIEVLLRLAEDPEEVVIRAVVEMLGCDVANWHFSNAHDLTEIWWYRRTFSKEDGATLLASSLPRVRAAVAGRSSISLDDEDLSHLVQDPEAEVRASVASNPELDFDGIVTLLGDDDSDVRAAATRELVDWLWRLARPYPEVDDSWLNGLLGAVPDIPLDYDGRLDRGRVRLGRGRVGSNWVSGLTEYIDVLARTDSGEVRAAVAGFEGQHSSKNLYLTRPATLTPETLSLLLSDSDRVVRSAALRNAGPAAIKVAQSDSAPIAALSHYALSRNEELREAVAGNTRTPGPVLANLARDNSSSVRAAVAANTSTSVDALAFLSGDPDGDVVLGLLANPNTPTAFLLAQAEFTADGSEMHRHERLAANASAPAEVLRKVAFSRWAHIREAVAVNPSTPEGTIEVLSSDENERVREAVARRRALGAP